MKYLFLLLLFLIPQFSNASVSSYSRTPTGDPVIAPTNIDLSADLEFFDECSGFATYAEWAIHDSVGTYQYQGAYYSGGFASTTYSSPGFPDPSDLTVDILFYFSDTDSNDYTLACDIVSLDTFTYSSASPVVLDLTYIFVLLLLVGALLAVLRPTMMKFSLS